MTAHFEKFAKNHGLLPTPTTLPLFERGSKVIWCTMPYLAWSARVYSIVSSKAPISTPDLLSYGTPLWHQRLFKKSCSLTYFFPHLIGELLEEEHYIQHIGHTCVSVYMNGIWHYAATPAATAIQAKIANLPFPQGLMCGLAGRQSRWCCSCVLTTYPHDSLRRYGRL